MNMVTLYKRHLLLIKQPCHWKKTSSRSSLAEEMSKPGFKLQRTGRPSWWELKQLVIFKWILCFFRVLESLVGFTVILPFRQSSFKTLPLYLVTKELWWDVVWDEYDFTLASTFIVLPVDHVVILPFKSYYIWSKFVP